MSAAADSVAVSDSHIAQTDGGASPNSNAATDNSINLEAAMAGVPPASIPYPSSGEGKGPAEECVIGAWEAAVLERYPPPRDSKGDASNDEDESIPLRPDPQRIAATRDAALYRDYSAVSGDGVEADDPPSADEEAAAVAAAQLKKTAATRARVAAFYKENHTRQTLALATAKRDDFLRFNRRRLAVWDAFAFLNTLVDDSDPDTDLDQFQHLLQTAEAIRRDGHPDWMVLVGLLHDLGKVLCLFGEPQWAVVGDTFPVGCAFSEKIIFHEFFEAHNSDCRDPSLSTLHGVYAPHCGLSSVTMSWGHDEYIYHVVQQAYADAEAEAKEQKEEADGAPAATPIHRIPEEGLYMLRYHSFYAWHKEGAYGHLTNAHDAAMLPWVRLFNPYDLYSKCEVKPDWGALRPYYEALVAKYLPPTIRF